VNSFIGKGRKFDNGDQFSSKTVRNPLKIGALDRLDVFWLRLEKTLTVCNWLHSKSRAGRWI